MNDMIHHDIHIFLDWKLESRTDRDNKRTSKKLKKPLLWIYLSVWNDQEDEVILSPARSSLSSSSSLTINSSLSYDNEAYLVYIPHIQWNESKASLSSHERLHFLLWAMDTPSSRLPSIPLKYTHWPIIIVDILFSKLLLGLTFFVNDASPRKVPNSLVFTA